MPLVASFNQVDFLEPVMRVDGWEAALDGGCCTVISAYFLSLALQGADIPGINEAFDRHRAEIAATQQDAIERHLAGLDGYGAVLNEVRLAWSGGVYLDPDGNLAAGQVALCLITMQVGAPHAIGLLYHQDQNAVFTFDPNVGVSREDPQIWYREFSIWVQRQYQQQVTQVQFNNVVLH